MFVEIVIFLLTGMFAGTASGLIGIGGGLVVVPALAYAFRWQGMSPDVVMHLAAGTSLSVMMATTMSGLLSHRRRGDADFRREGAAIFRGLLPGVLCGTVLGVVFADVLPTHWLKGFFGLFALFIATRMFFLVKPHPDRRLPGKYGLAAFGLLVGGKSGLLGLGGGALTVPFLTRCNVSMRQAVLVSVSCGFVIAMTGAAACMITGFNEPLLPKWSTGYVYWPAFLCIAPTTPVFAAIGAKFSHRLPVNVLKRVFSVFLLCVAIDMLVQI